MSEDNDEYEELDPAELQEDEEDEKLDRGDLVEEEGDEDEDLEDPKDEEEDDEPEDDEDPKDDDDDEDEDDENDDGNKLIPRSRLNQVIQQREAERERAAWLEDQLETLIKQRNVPEPQPKEDPPEPSYDFDTAEESYTELLLEGDTKGAAALRREINAEVSKETNRQIQEGIKQATKESSEATVKTLEDEKFDIYLEKITVEKSYLNADSDDYDEKAVKMANSLMSSYIAEGLPRTKALAQAVDDISSLFEKPEKPNLGGDASKRTKEARKRAVKAADAQPPASERRSRSKSAKDLDALDIAKMSDKEFNSLTKKEIAALRGD